MSVPIYGLQKTTLLDYPGHVASTIFFGYCNFRCPYCHNSSLFCPTSNQTKISEEKIMSHFKKRQGIIEGICITGGEPTLFDELPDFIKQLKTLGYLIKLDTNGSNPSMLQLLLKEKLIDFIAMDIKNSPSRYTETIGCQTLNFKDIQSSVELLKNASIPHEFRTTVVEEFHRPKDIIAISDWLKGPSPYYLQNFKYTDTVIHKHLHPLTDQQLHQYLSLAQKNLPNANIRGGF